MVPRFRHIISSFISLVMLSFLSSMEATSYYGDCPLANHYSDASGMGVFAGKDFDEHELFEISLGIPVYLPHARHTALGEKSRNDTNN